METGRSCERKELGQEGYGGWRELTLKEVGQEGFGTGRGCGCKELDRKELGTERRLGMNNKGTGITWDSNELGRKKWDQEGDGNGRIKTGWD
jgi:hypothetical protein